MIDELIEKVSSKLDISPEQSRAGLGILLKFAQTELGPKFALIQSNLPEVDALIAAAPAAAGLGGLLGGLLGGSKLGGLAGLVGQAEQAGLSREQLEGIGKHAVDFLEGRGGKAAEVAGLIKGFLP